MKANKSYVLNTAGKDGEEGGSLYMSRKKGKENNYFVSKNGIHFGEGSMQSVNWKIVKCHNLSSEREKRKREREKVAC